jgi:2-keto-4-pentenoate hydratase/2-oxohepta-3-ene-1,7-dioic acid hydratase in catechol pathway
VKGQPRGATSLASPQPSPVKRDHVSQDETLHAGEFFGPGTVGNGSGLEQGRFLTPGDVVELEVEGLGMLRNRVLKQD